MNDRSEGWVRNIEHARGFAFLQQDTTDVQLFAHIKSFRDPDAFRELQVGHRVSFQATEGPRGPRAEDVELL